jgi:hypothetical protein
MIGRRAFAGMFLGSTAMVALGGCGELNPYKFKAKVTVYVDTPEGVRSGSSVYELWANWSNPGATSRVYGQRGEAVAVDLPNGKTLFSLLITIKDEFEGIIRMVLTTVDPEFENTMVESTKKLSGYGNSDPYMVAPENYPVFVTFDDIKDPTSIKKVDPVDLSASFGEGYRLRAVAVQVTTDEAVTKEIHKRLEWLHAINQKRFGQKSPPTGIPLGNFNGLFSTETSK